MGDLKKSLKDFFTSVFNSKAIENNYLQLEDKKEKKYYQITLAESENLKKECTLQQITLRGFDEIFYAIKFDAANFLHRKRKDNENDYSDSLIKDNTFYKVCDYILWVEFKGKKMILIIELKSKEYKNADIFLKFRNSGAFLQYLEAFTEKHPKLSKEKFHPVSILIHNKTYDRELQKNEEYGFYNKGLKESAEPWYITNNFCSILKQENLLT